MTDSTRTVVIILLIFAAWEFVPRATGITPLLFPPFSAVLGALLRNLNPTTGGPLWGYTYTTVSILFVSYVLSIVIAMCLATWATMSVWGRDFLKVITSVFQPLPAVALLPLAIVWFGLNTQSLIFVVIMAMLWPLAASLSTGFGTVPLTRDDRPGRPHSSAKRIAVDL
jgi:NitT/TauT family transport system permease protein